jgi:ABC-type multidrug transport system ATPase subunit
MGDDSYMATTTGQNGDRVDGIIRTAGLTKVYEGTDFKAVDALDLTIRRGEIFGRGPGSGSG